MNKSKHTLSSAKHDQSKEERASHSRQVTKLNTYIILVIFCLYCTWAYTWASFWEVMSTLLLQDLTHV